jgi:hypothetical protein
MFMFDLGAPSLYSVLGVTPEAEGPEIRAMQNRRHAEVARSLARSTDPEEKRRLEDQLRELNAAGDELANPVRRQGYDRDNAHVTFFVTCRAGAPAFNERDLWFEWIHRAVRDFLAVQGEPVDPMTDLERADFTADFTANELLDRALEPVEPSEGGQ